MTDVRGATLDVCGCCKKVESLEEAWESKIRPSLSAIADHWATVSWTHCLWSSEWIASLCGPTRADHWYTHPDDPFRAMHDSKRGFALQLLSELYDGSEYTGYEVTAALLRTSAFGQLHKDHDYRRKSRKLGSACLFRSVEVKSARLQCRESCTHWRLEFVGIKPDCHEDLVLVVYLPWGIEIWDHVQGSSKGMLSLIHI
eukprot:4905412-Amphidinium_carterae.1